MNKVCDCQVVSPRKQKLSRKCWTNQKAKTRGIEITSWVVIPCQWGDYLLMQMLSRGNQWEVTLTHREWLLLEVTSYYYKYTRLSTYKRTSTRQIDNGILKSIPSTLLFIFYSKALFVNFSQCLVFVISQLFPFVISVILMKINFISISKAPNSFCSLFHHLVKY